MSDGVVDQDIRVPVADAGVVEQVVVDVFLHVAQENELVEGGKSLRIHAVDEESGGRQKVCEFRVDFYVCCVGCW